MEQAADIKFMNLFLGYLLLIVPLWVFYRIKSGLLKDTLVSVGRMTVQLLMVGIYLDYIFRFNNWIINLCWLIIMLYIATFTTIRTSKLSRKHLFIPMFISLSLGIVVVDVFFIGIVIDMDYLFDSRYLIPISGIMLGNMLRTNIMALSGYFSEIRNQRETYQYYLANGGTQQEALLPFLQEAMKTAFNPTIANISVVGLINLPGVMTGQILGGSDPMNAVKYQILIMISIFVSAMITVIGTIVLSTKTVFDELGNMKQGIIRGN